MTEANKRIEYNNAFLNSIGLILPKCEVTHMWIGDPIRSEGSHGPVCFLIDGKTVLAEGFVVYCPKEDSRFVDTAIYKNGLCQEWFRIYIDIDKKVNGFECSSKQQALNIVRMSDIAHNTLEELLLLNMNLFCDFIDP